MTDLTGRLNDGGSCDQCGSKKVRCGCLAELRRVIAHAKVERQIKIDAQNAQKANKMVAEITQRGEATAAELPDQFQKAILDGNKYLVVTWAAMNDRAGMGVLDYLRNKLQMMDMKVSIETYAISDNGDFYKKLIVEF